MPAWPTSLPASPDRDGFSEQPQSQVLRSQMDAGPAKTRRRFTAAARGVPVQYLLTKTQAETFEAFFEADLAAGALPFNWVHPRTGAAVSVLIVGDPPYQLLALGGQWWRLVMQLEVQP